MRRDRKRRGVMDVSSVVLLGDFQVLLGLKWSEDERCCCYFRSLRRGEKGKRRKKKRPGAGEANIFRGLDSFLLFLSFGFEQVQGINFQKQGEAHIFGMSKQDNLTCF